MVFVKVPADFGEFLVLKVVGRGTTRQPEEVVYQLRQGKQRRTGVEAVALHTDTGQLASRIGIAFVRVHGIPFHGQPNGGGYARNTCPYYGGCFVMICVHCSSTLPCFEVVAGLWIVFSPVP
jgi:hypothetical protein